MDTQKFWISLATDGFSRVKERRLSDAKSFSLATLRELLTLPDPNEGVRQLEAAYSTNPTFRKLAGLASHVDLVKLQRELLSNDPFRKRYIHIWQRTFPGQKLPGDRSLMIQMLTYDFAFYSSFRYDAEGDATLKMQRFIKVPFQTSQSARVVPSAPAPAFAPLRVESEDDLRRIQRLIRESFQLTASPLNIYPPILKSAGALERISYSAIDVQSTSPRVEGHLIVGDHRTLSKATEKQRKNLQLFTVTKEQLDPRRGSECGDIGDELRVLRNYQKFAQSVVCPQTAPAYHNGTSGLSGLLIWATTGAGKTCLGKAMLETFTWDLTDRKYHRWTWVTDGSLSTQTILKKSEICGWRQLCDVLFPPRDFSDVLSKVMVGMRQDPRNMAQRRNLFNSDIGETLMAAYMGNPKPRLNSGEHLGNVSSCVLKYGTLLTPLQKAFRAIKRYEDPLHGMLMIVDEAHLLFGAQGEGSGLDASHVKTKDPDGSGALFTRSAFIALSEWRKRPSDTNFIKAANALKGVVSGFNGREIGIPAIYRLTAALAYSNLVNRTNPLRIALLTATPIRNDYRELLHLMNLTKQYPHDPVSIAESQLTVDPSGRSLAYSFPIVTPGNAVEMKAFHLRDLFSGTVSRVKADENPRQYPIKIAMSKCAPGVYPEGINTVSAGLVACAMSPYQFAMFKAAGGGSIVNQLRKKRVALSLAIAGGGPKTIVLPGVAPTIEQLAETFAKLESKGELFEGMHKDVRVVPIELEVGGEVLQATATESQATQLGHSIEIGERVGVRLGREGEVLGIALGKETDAPDVLKVSGMSHSYADLHHVFKPIEDLKTVEIHRGPPRSKHISLVGGAQRPMGLQMERSIAFRGMKGVRPDTWKEDSGREESKAAELPKGDCSSLEVSTEVVPRILSSEHLVDPVDKVQKLSPISVECRFDVPGYSPDVLTAYHPAVRVGENVIGMKGLDLVSSKYMKLMQMIHHLDKKGLQKHVIYTDLAVSGYGVSRAIVGALMATPFLGFDGKYYRPQLQGILKEDFKKDGSKYVLDDMVYVPIPQEGKDGKRTWKWVRQTKCPHAPTVLILGSAGVRDPRSYRGDPFYIKHNAAKKDAIIRFFNSRTDNVHGEAARFLVIDREFRQGLDLFNSPYMHVMDTPLSEADFTQTIGRVARLCGAAQLPFDRSCGWQDQIFLYLATLCPGWPCSPDEQPAVLYSSIMKRLRSLSGDSANLNRMRNVEVTEAFVLNPANGMILDAELNAAYLNTGYGTTSCPTEDCASGRGKQWMKWSDQKKHVYQGVFKGETLPGLSEAVAARRGPDAGSGRPTQPATIAPRPAIDHTLPSGFARPPPSVPQFKFTLPPHLETRGEREGGYGGRGTSRRGRMLVEAAGRGMEERERSPRRGRFREPRRGQDNRDRNRDRDYLPRRRRSSSIEPPRRPVAPPHQPKKPVVSDDEEEEAWDSSMGPDTDSDDDEMPRGLLPPRRTHSRRA